MPAFFCYKTLGECLYHRQSSNQNRKRLSIPIFIYSQITNLCTNMTRGEFDFIQRQSFELLL